jgi:hypothetical protein
VYIEFGRDFTVDCCLVVLVVDDGGVYVDQRHDGGMFQVPQDMHLAVGPLGISGLIEDPLHAFDSNCLTLKTIDMSIMI